VTGMHWSLADNRFDTGVCFGAVVRRVEPSGREWLAKKPVRQGAKRSGECA